MSLLLVIAAVVMLGAGIVLRVVKHGEDNDAHVLRVTSVALLTMALVVGVYAIPWVNSHFDWYYFTALTICIVASFTVSFLARNPVRLDTDGDFQKKSKEELKGLNDDERKAYKEELKTYKKAHRHHRWSKASSLVALSAAVAAGAIFLTRLWFHVNLEKPLEPLDPTYHPTHWWALMVPLVLVAVAVVMRFPLRLKKAWMTLPLAVVAAILVIWLAIIPAGITFKEEADDLYQSAAELEAEQKPPVEDRTEWILTACPSDFRLGDEDQDGVVDEETLKAAKQAPDYYRASKDVDFLIDQATTKGFWKEGLHTPEDLTVIIEVDPDTGNTLLCLTPPAWHALGNLYPEWEQTAEESLAELDIKLEDEAPITIE